MRKIGLCINGKMEECESESEFSESVKSDA